MNEADCADILPEGQVGGWRPRVQVVSALARVAVEGGAFSPLPRGEGAGLASVRYRAFRAADDLLRLRELLLGSQGDDRAVEGDAYHLIHRLDQMKLHLVANVGRDLLGIAFVVCGQNHARDTGARSSEDLVLHAADGQDFAAQRDLA